MGLRVHGEEDVPARRMKGSHPRSLMVGVGAEGLPPVPFQTLLSRASLHGQSPQWPYYLRGVFPEKSKTKREKPETWP